MSKRYGTTNARVTEACGSIAHQFVVLTDRLEAAQAETERQEERIRDLESRGVAPLKWGIEEGDDIGWYTGDEMRSIIIYLREQTARQEATLLKQEERLRNTEEPTLDGNTLEDWRTAYYALQQKHIVAKVAIRELERETDADKAYAKGYFDGVCARTNTAEHAAQGAWTSGFKAGHAAAMREVVR